MPEAMGIERMTKQLFFLKGYNAENNIPYIILNPEDFGEETLSDSEVDSLVGKTGDELEAELDGRNLAREEYEKLLRKERENQDRKTVKDMLSKKANLTGKNSDIDVLAIDREDKVIAVECKAEGEPFRYRKYDITDIVHKDDSEDGELEGALANFVNQIGYVRDSEFKYLNKEEYRDDEGALKVDEYWMVVKGGFEYGNQEIYASELEQNSSNVKELKEEIGDRLSVAPEKIVLKNSIQVFMEIFEEVQEDMGKKRERYSSPLLEAFRHISASADNERETEYLFSKMEDLCSQDVEKKRFDYEL